MNSENRNEIAAELRSLFNAISPFFEKHTSKVCPFCKKVCCIKKHGQYNEEDIIVLTALNIDIPSFKLEGEDTAPCRFLTGKGCSLQRLIRPFQCTWYFCEPLHGSMLEDSSMTYNEFIDNFKKLVEIRRKLVDFDKNRK